MSTTDDSFAIGVDVGATTIKSGIVDGSGTILEQVVVDARPLDGPPAVLEQLAISSHRLLEKADRARCMGIGIGSPGVVTTEDGHVHYPPNFVGWTNVDVAGPVRREFDLAVEIENDANAAALAESRYGAGKDFKDFVFVIWGTGVGGGIIIDRAIYHGPHGGAGEIGHVSIDYNGPQCNCGNFGCIEAYVGQRYLSSRTRELLARAGTTNPANGSAIVELVGGNLDRIEPYVISMAADRGDRMASAILKEAGGLLGFALASIVNILDIRTFVIGGGISAAPDFVFDEITTALRSRVLTPHRSNIHIVRAHLGNAAGIVGAASLVMS